MVVTDLVKVVRFIAVVQIPMLYQDAGVDCSAFLTLMDVPVLLDLKDAIVTQVRKQTVYFPNRRHPFLTTALKRPRSTLHTLGWCYFRNLVAFRKYCFSHKLKTNEVKHIQ